VMVADDFLSSERPAILPFMLDVTRTPIMW
jgi:hypothetical protein